MKRREALATVQALVASGFTDDAGISQLVGITPKAVDLCKMVNCYSYDPEIQEAWVSGRMSDMQLYKMWILDVKEYFKSNKPR